MSILRELVSLRSGSIANIEFRDLELAAWSISLSVRSEQPG